MEYENLQIEIPIDDDEEEKGSNESVLNPAWEKTYHNKSKSKGFAVGLDLQSKEAQDKRLNRAKRFGITPTTEGKKEENPFEKIQLAEIEWPPVIDAAYAEIRPKCIHVFGVDSMSTKDVFDYFKNYGPDTMEWIDDYSCNVLWETDEDAKLALKGMSKTIEEIAKLNSDDIEDDFTVDEVDENARELWRIALPYKNNKSLFIRQATVKDKKLPGAAKRSLYYLTHGKRGNRGRKGLVSSSRKRRIKQAESFVKENLGSKGPDVTFLDADDKDNDDEGMDVDSDNEEPLAKRFQLHDSAEKGITIRMRANKSRRGGRDHSQFPNEQLKITASFERKNRGASDRQSRHRPYTTSSDEDEDYDDDRYARHESSTRSKEKYKDLRDSLGQKHEQNKKSVATNEVVDLRKKIEQNKKHLGLTKEQLNLCIEVTEVSDEDDL
eukprot:gene18851-20749_t